MRKNNSKILGFAFFTLFVLWFCPIGHAAPSKDILTRFDSTISKVDTVIAAKSTSPHASANLSESSPLVSYDPETHDQKFLHEAAAMSQEKKIDCGANGRLCDTIDEDINEQSLKGVTKNLKIDQAFIEAKKSELKNLGGHWVEEIEEPQPAVEIPENVIRGVLNSETSGQKIDLDFDEVKLSDIFATLGKTAGVNVLLDPSLQSQQLDLHLKQVTLEEAFILIANAYNLGFKRVADSLYVTNRDKLREESISSRVFKLKNISAAVAKIMIENIAKEIKVSEEINSLIVVGQPEEIIKAESVINRIDIPQPQVILESQIIEMARDSLHDMGVDWQDSLTVNYQEDLRNTTLDDVTETDVSPLRVASFTRTPLQFQSMIKMLENQNKAKILSSPRITTLNNKEAQIFVGDQVPYTVTTISGGATTTEVRFVEPGIRLKITPSIIDRNFVVIKVEPEVSFIFTFRGPNSEYPQIRTRKATAFVRVQNRQLFVLGGILNQEDKQSFFKVPMLGDIPLIGNLFNYKKQTALDTELIITVVPTVVQGDI